MQKKVADSLLCSLLGSLNGCHLPKQLVLQEIYGFIFDFWFRISQSVPLSLSLSKQRVMAHLPIWGTDRVGISLGIATELRGRKAGFSH